MTKDSYSLIWKRLLVEQKKMVTTSQIEELALKLGKNKKRAVYYLQEEGYIARVLRGIFYVKSLEERQNNALNNSLYTIVAWALEIKKVKNWYFALETALKLNNLTHEYYTVDYVFTDSYRTTKKISIMKNKFQFLKRSKKYFKKGIREKNKIRYSNSEKTVLDLAYHRFLKTKNEDVFLSPLIEYKNKIDVDKIKRLLDFYPCSFQKKVEVLL